MKLSGVCLVTADVNALAGFYERLLGVRAPGDGEHREFENMGLAIFSWSGMDRMAPGCVSGAGRGAVTLNFLVDDADGEYEKVLRIGAPVVKPPQTHPWGSRSFWFRDPDGNLVNFHQIL